MKIAAKLNRLREAGLTVFYPQPCAECGASVELSKFGASCAACWRKTKIFSGNETICEKCSRVLPVQTKTDEPAFVRCHRCDELSFTAARAVGAYDGALRSAVLQLKEKPLVARHLVNLLFRVQQKPPLAQAARIIPVPLHPRRERMRGFNQAALLARALSRKTKLPLHENVLVRHVYTAPHRVGMDERARRESVAEVFAIKNPRLIENEKVLLVDDVYTTGATASACAEVLKEAGADEVFVLTVARAE